ncbi:MarR family winged helix-turn-helix transcriptional regulator [Amycolatopsis sp. FDAARGOS 1241]|uniref:MarR family winged helix-turn-helix transcriptional regulator n=1 Tax=Amycolatopsis sp. FDAARGOS 1241 TaxID=2778070 RepID=UPI0019521DB9|nr:MarR family transcriptional regulator [Amycolatopsis sp. FDAARGOS 1241]QRP43955.1 MarR family transcriptional regulator [Amycolatopsis sp. FDAARGOS 1241]
MPSGDDDEVAERVWARVRSLVLDRHERKREVCDALGMSFIKIKALRRVAARPLTMSELTEQLNTDRPYTTHVVDELVRRGLVLREQHPEDRRSRVVTVTPAGHDAAALANRILGEPPKAMLAMSSEDLAELDRLTELLVD